jgi:RNase H-fold protein (predicted Holliday junction resolvase)
VTGGPGDRGKESYVLGIDPGRSKCGLAVISSDSLKIAARAVVELPELAARARQLVGQYDIERIIIGSGTGAKNVSSIVKKAVAAHEGVEVVDAPEKGTTLAARRLYFEANPPRGWRRLLPAGMRVPPEPYDDFSAAIIAIGFVEREAEGCEARDPR